jgi:hypothetical protein
MADETHQTQAPSEAPADGKDGFSAAFAERSADPAGQAAKSQEDEEGKPPSSDQGPAVEAGSEEAPAGKAAATEQTSSGQAKAFDPYDGMSPEQRSYWERKEASERSNRGRVGALTKKLNAVTIGTPAPKAPERTEEQGGQASEGGEGEGGDTVSDLDKRLQAVTDEYGDVVGPVVELLKEVRTKIDTLEKGPALKAEIDADAEVLTEAYGELEKVHPDYATIAADQNFNAWLGDQPQKVIDLANSFDPREVSLVLTLFKTERSAATAPQSGQSSETGTTDGTATDDRRKRQLEGSRQVPGKGQPAVAGVPDDFSSAFKARAGAQR